MDLIYADTNRKDIGTIDDFKFDLAYGVDENNFILELDLNHHCCKEGYIVYIESEKDGLVEGSEYGGVIDKIEVNTENNKVMYSGRTWHGILAEAIIEPLTGQDYFQISGECNATISAIIKHVHLDDLFEVSDENSGIIIYDISRFRYSNVYDSLRSMLFGAEAKLKIEYKNRRLLLSAVPYVDYSQNEEWDSSQIGFKIKKNFKPINHLICLGNGEMKNRHVIHLFSDEYGNVQPYKVTDNPVKDSDYILDRRNQVLYGLDERTDTLDYPNASDKINYVLLTSKPSDWDVNYEQYYKLSVNSDGSSDYTKLTSNTTSAYNPLTSKPSDWDANCEKYYEIKNYSYTSVSRILNSDMQLVTTKPSDWNLRFGGYYWHDEITDTYSKVVVTVVENYTQLSAYPADWSTNYGNYYERYFFDGTDWHWRAWQGVSAEKYVLLTSQPSDWKTGTYYYKSNGKYVEREKYEKFETNKYYRKETYTVAPIIEVDVTGAKPNVWIRETEEIIPDFNAQSVYQECGTYVAPTFAAGKYYVAVSNRVNVEWEDGLYYRMYTDHFANLIESGLAKFEEYRKCDSIETSLDASTVYDIGDVVGATEQVTGLSVWQPVTKKIVTIQNNHEIIQYKIG